MFKKITTSLSKPPLVIFFIKDAWKHVVLYILFLPLILIIPSIVISFTQSAMTNDMYDAVYQTVKQSFRFDDVVLSDYTLTYQEPYTISLDTFDLSIGQYENSTAISFVFETQGVSIYALGQEVNYHSYESLGIASIDFSSTESKDIHALSLMIKNIYQEQTFFIIGNLVFQYFLYLFDYLIIVLIMTVLSKMMLPMGMKVPFKTQFKLSAYLSTIYVFSNLVLILLGLYAYNFLSITLVYIYHLWAFRSIKVIPKGASQNGK